MHFIFNKNHSKAMKNQFKKIKTIFKKTKNDLIFNLKSEQLLELQKKVFINKIFNQNNLNPILFIRTIQDKVQDIFTSDINTVVLKQSRFWAQSITTLLMGGTAFSFIWLGVAKTDEIVIAVGKLEPKGGVIDVQMPLEGIAREILIKEGELVKKGQILIKLDTEITKARNDALTNNLQLNQNITDKLGKLVKEGAVSELQYLQQKAKIEDIKSEITANKVRMKYQEIISPADGIVFQLQPKSPGYVAKSSQPVLQIVPSKNLIANVEIESRTIGFVEKGKLADISIDSFPASDFGVIEGEVLSIGSDALEPAQGKGYRFPAKISLSNQYLQLKSGKKLKLQAGMSLTANIKLRKVSYLQLLLGTFRDKSKSLRTL